MPSDEEGFTAKSRPQIDQSNFTIRQNECLPYNIARVNRYTGYIRYTGICLDTGNDDIDNSKIPIYRHLGILLGDTGFKRYFKSILCVNMFRN